MKKRTSRFIMLRTLLHIVRIGKCNSEIDWNTFKYPDHHLYDSKLYFFNRKTYRTVLVNGHAYIAV